jgi:superfamily II DNA or RNA helicase
LPFALSSAKRVSQSARRVLAATGHSMASPTVQSDLMTAHPTQQYQQEDLTRWVSHRTLGKAQAYKTRVRDLEIGSTRISAHVQGSQRLPYSVEIDFFRDLAGGFRVEMRCTCPVGYGCKHAAAVLLVALTRREQPPTVNPEVVRWAEALGAAVRPRAAKTRPRRAGRSAPTIHYVIGWSPIYDRYNLDLLKGRADDLGPQADAVPWHNIERALVQPPQFVDESDLPILRALRRVAGGRDFWGALPLGAAFPGDTLQQMCATGRLWLANEQEEPGLLGRRIVRYVALAGGPPRPATVHWHRNEFAQIVPALVATPPAEHILPTAPPWYLDPAGGETGPLDCAGHEEVYRRLLELPPLGEIDLPVVAGALQESCPEIPSPLAEGGRALRVIDAPPTPVLAITSVNTWYVAPHRGYHDSYRTGAYDYAVPRFRYGEITVAAADPGEYFTTTDGETVRVQRRREDEKRRIDSLARFGFKPPPRGAIHADRPLPDGRLGLESEAAWARFTTDTAPVLREAGWQVEIDPAFRHLLLEVEHWEANVAEVEGGWLDVDMGIVVDGRRLPLAPLLHDLFHRDPRWLDPDALRQMSDDESVIVTTPENQRLRLPAGRIRPLAQTLIDLFDAPPTGPLRMSRFEAARLSALTDRDAWRGNGLDTVARLAERLQGAERVQPVAAPASFGLTLRPYQQEGLAWMQYLRANDLAGILADDMGLGKTAQTLAHLLTEKQAGRLDRPALVVLPTSLVFNWRSETARCAPELRVLSLHGKERAERFAQIPEHDVCLTTYPLLWRDEKELAAHEYHTLILDEAQMVKNATSRAAGVVRRLKTRHRLCLTGTPLENHLGELWAQFDFLLPGFLGDARRFTTTWRTPIEKHGDRLRRDLLARRVRPFILRRRKEDVATELPPKTVIVRTVELEGGQRDLYETVRSAMDARVREEIAARGFSRSQIVILDALLKLRQVCCDPRLLKTKAAEKVKERAKLALLMDMLPELVDEGRRVLLFSQFTSMLALIRAELERIGMAHELLTGDTRDREAVVSRFQKGGVPVFLISLKAGGVGLNLTAADTVIHFDPWWNPAVEAQATDRAHRIGQQRNVFVYKLVVAGSIEEKILALQEKKAELAAGVLAEDGEALAKFGEADIRALLEPLR